MDNINHLLLQRVAVLRRHLKEENYNPLPETLDGFFMDLEQALEHAQAASLLSEREKTDILQHLDLLDQKNQVLRRQNEALEREKENLERQVKTLERHNEQIQRVSHQTERQNASLQSQITSLEDARQRYHDLFEHAPDAYLITNNGGIIQEASYAARELLHASPAELKGENLLTFVAPRDHQLVMSLLTRLQRIQEIELCIQPRGKPAVDTSLTLSSFYDEAGNPIRLRWMLRDVTERRRAISALNASERRFRTIFNEANLGILLIDLQGRIVRANRAFQDILGYAEEELFNHPLSELACPEDVPIQQVTLALRENRQTSLSLDYRFLRRDGQYIWTSLSLSILRNDDGKPQYLIGMVKDIHAEKQAEVELAEMRRRLLESGEVERLRLAQELHDGPMQDLYGGIFSLSSMTDLQADPAVKAKLVEIQTLIKDVASTLRSIVGELRPPTLRNLGLERAIRSHAERVQEDHPEMEIKLQLTRDGQALAAHTRLAFFRIYQQCMANVLRHSKASQVLVSFHLNDDTIFLDIWDNGKGFTLPEKWVELLREGHRGLAVIAERVDALGGVLKIDTKPGAGTLVHVTAPRE